MREYTPTMYQAQGSYVNGSMSKGRYEGNRARRRSEYRAEFHRWLAKERAAARREGQAQAWAEGHSWGWSDAQDAHDVRQEMARADWPLCTPNPYETEEDQ